MSELHIPTLRRVANRQLKDSGRISPEILDMVIEDWGIDYSRYKDRHQAKALWRGLIRLYLINPDLYSNACSYIEGLYDTVISQKRKGDDIPDIVA